MTEMKNTRKLIKRTVISAMTAAMTVSLMPAGITFAADETEPAANSTVPETDTGAAAQREVRITYFSDIQGVESKQDSPVKTGQTVKLSPNTFEREGYVFAGWKRTGSDGTSVYYTDGQEIIADDEISLHAVWVPADTITYKPGKDAAWKAGDKDKVKNRILENAADAALLGSEGLENSSILDPQKDYTIPSPERKGWTFAGWLDKDGRFLKNSVIKAGTTGEQTYTAVWIRNKADIYWGESLTYLDAADADVSAVCKSSYANKKGKVFLSLKDKTAAAKYTPEKIKNPVKIKVKANGKTYTVKVNIGIKAPDITVKKQTIKENGQKVYKYKFIYKKSDTAVKVNGKTYNADRIRVRMTDRKNDSNLNKIFDTYVSKNKSTSESYITFSKKAVQQFEKTNGTITFKVQAKYGGNWSESKTIMAKD